MARKNSKVTDKKLEVESEEEEEEASTSSEEVDASMMAENDGEGEQQEERSDDDGDEDSEDGNEDDGDDDETESEIEEEEEDEEMSDENKQERDGKSSNSLSADGSEQCTFDLTNLLAFNTHQINAAQLYSAAPNSKLDKEWYTSANVTISSTLPHPVNEALLLEKAAAGTTQLLRELWRLPMEKKSSDVGLMAKLTAADGSAVFKLPRSLVRSSVANFCKGTFVFHNCMESLFFS